MGHLRITRRVSLLALCIYLCLSTSHSPKHKHSSFYQDTHQITPLWFHPMTSIKVKSNILAWVVKSSVIWSWANFSWLILLYSCAHYILAILAFFLFLGKLKFVPPRAFEVVVDSAWHILPLFLGDCLFLVTQISSQMLSLQNAFFYHDLKGVCIANQCFSLNLSVQLTTVFSSHHNCAWHREGIW